MARVLGISASLRNARHRVGSQRLVKEIEGIADKDGLGHFLKEQTNIRAEDFIAAGRGAGQPFDEIYKKLRKMSGERGLSNSEAALTAALWGAKQTGAEIDHLPLASYFPASGKVKNPEELKARLLKADGILLSGPVYFGDRGSVTQALVEFIAADAELSAGLKGVVYGGLAVGAKRNGGQETMLVYQLIDFVNLDMLGVGNDSGTTSQYGGTIVAGDVGTAWKDDYGMNTAIGTGRRVARVAHRKLLANGYSLGGPLRAAVLVLQDTHSKRGMEYYERWRDAMMKRVKNVEIELRNYCDEEVLRCIACDICPEQFGERDDYRCIIKSKRDLFVQHHEDLMDLDAVLLGAYSPRDRSNIRSVYQTFIERTRYIRRDNYAMGDTVWAPFVISEVSANQNLHIRMLTSAVRHHTILHHPLIGVEHQNALLNEDDLLACGERFLEVSRTIAVGHHVESAATGADAKLYVPIGYELSRLKTDEALATGGLRAVANRNSNRQFNQSRVVKI